MGTQYLVWWQPVPEVPARNQKSAHVRSSATCHVACPYLPTYLPAILWLSP